MPREFKITRGEKGFECSVRHLSPEIEANADSITHVASVPEASQSLNFDFAVPKPPQP